MCSLLCMITLICNFVKLILLHGPRYEDYKFVSREELDSLNLTHLIGTNLLRAYMHGFFMDARLYREVS